MLYDQNIILHVGHSIGQFVQELVLVDLAADLGISDAVLPFPEPSRIEMTQLSTVPQNPQTF